MGDQRRAAVPALLFALVGRRAAGDVGGARERPPRDHGLTLEPVDLVRGRSRGPVPARLAQTPLTFAAPGAAHAPAAAAPQTSARRTPACSSSMARTSAGPRCSTCSAATGSRRISSSRSRTTARHAPLRRRRSRPPAGGRLDFQPPIASGAAPPVTSAPESSRSPVRSRSGASGTHCLPRGGMDPEALEHVRLAAPEAFRSRKRAVTESDYAESPSATPRAAGRSAFRWTGNWYTAFVAVDRMAAAGSRRRSSATSRAFSTVTGWRATTWRSSRPSSSRPTSRSRSASSRGFRCDVKHELLEHLRAGRVPGRRPRLSSIPTTSPSGAPLPESDLRPPCSRSRVCAGCADRFQR